MKKINEVHQSVTRQEKIIQFGEGNFLRCFADWMINRMNEEVDFDGNVVVVQPIAKGMTELLSQQECVYTVRLNGVKGEEVVSTSEVVDVISRCVNPYIDYEEYLYLSHNKETRFIISNTTEAGIVYDENDSYTNTPPTTFPGKLTALLYERFTTFGMEEESGFIIIPCELIENNGTKLKEIVIRYANQWDLGSDFISWIESENEFCNTLVDRIVPGFPRDRIDEINDENGYIDNFVVEGELFHLWVIEGSETVKKEFNPQDAGLNVVYTDNLKPYRDRKVHILNGAHTSMVPVGLLLGIESVREGIEDEALGTFIKNLIYEEVIPTLDLEKEELELFAKDVIDRFKNPFIHHKLISIALNSLSKYKSRVLPTVINYIDLEKKLPHRAIFALAALLRLYKGEYKGLEFKLKDNQEWIKDVQGLWNNVDNGVISLDGLVDSILKREDIWGRNLSELPGVVQQVKIYLDMIDMDIKKAICEVI